MNGKCTALKAVFYMLLELLDDDFSLTKKKKKKKAFDLNDITAALPVCLLFC